MGSSLSFSDLLTGHRPCELPHEFKAPKDWEIISGHFESVGRFKERDRPRPAKEAKTCSFRSMLGFLRGLRPKTFEGGGGRHSPVHPRHVGDFPMKQRKPSELGLKFLVLRAEVDKHTNGFVRAQPFGEAR